MLRKMQVFIIMFAFFTTSDLRADFKSHLDYEDTIYSKLPVFNIHDMNQFLVGKKFFNSDDFIGKFIRENPNFLDSFLVVVDSESRQKASVTHPRIVYFSRDNDVVFSVSGRPIDTDAEDLNNYKKRGSLNPPFYDTVEIIYEDPKKNDGTLKFETIDFESTTGKPLLKENNSCIQCHANSNHSPSQPEKIQQSTSYIWANYAYWPGALPEQDPGTGSFSFYETTAIGQFLSSLDNKQERYRHLNHFFSALNQNSSTQEDSLYSNHSDFELLLTPKEDQIKNWQPKARRLAQMSQSFLYAANKKSLKRLAHHLKGLEDYEKSKYVILSILMHCDQGNRPHISDYFSSLKQNSLDEIQTIEKELYERQLKFTDFSKPLGRRSEAEIFKRLSRLDMPFVPTTARLKWYLNYKWGVDLSDYTNHPDRKTLMFWDGFTGLTHLALAMQRDFSEFSFLKDPVFQGGLFATLSSGYLPSESSYEDAIKVFERVDLSLKGNLDSLYDLTSHQIMCEQLIHRAKGN